MKKLLIALGLLSSFYTNAQHFNSNKSLDDLFYSDSNSLYFNLSNYNFVWNNEFFNPIVDGYTLIGYNFKPTIEYHFTTNIKAEGGAYLQKYSGIDKITRTLPVYSVTWHNKSNALVAGTIHGASFHRLPDQILHQERQLDNAQEDGLQYVFTNNRLFADIWLNWKTFIFKGDSKQEELFGGASIEPLWLSSTNFKIFTPMSFLIYHQGGQIDSVDRSLKTLVNYSTGIRIAKTFNSKWVNNISFDSRLIGYKDNSPNPQSLYHAGWGITNSLKTSYNQCYLSVGYWYADKYLSMIGNPIFSCNSTISPDKNVTKRQLLVGELHLGKKITGYFEGAFMVNAYYDLLLSEFDYTYAIALILQPNFLVKRFQSQNQIH